MVKLFAMDKKHFVEKDFKQEVSLIDWSNLYCQKYVNLVYNILEIGKIINTMAPLKKIQLRNKTTQWVKAETTCHP